MKKKLILGAAVVAIALGFLFVNAFRYPIVYSMINSGMDEEVVSQLLLKEGFTRDTTYQGIQERWFRKEIIGTWHIALSFTKGKASWLGACYETPWNDCFRARNKDLVYTKKK